MSESAAPDADARRHLVILELDAQGQIDGHAAMCLRLTVDELLADGAEEIVIDCATSWRSEATRSRG